MTDARENVFQVLRRHGVRFAVIGGHAVNVHGFIRATEDHDVVFLRTPESEMRLLAALQEIKARWIDDEIDPATGIERQIPVSLSYLKALRMMMLLTDEGFLDIFDYVPGCPEEPVEQLISDAISVSGINYASKPWLLRMKRAAGRPKDLLDIENLDQGNKV